MPAAQPGAPLAADGVDLGDEDDGGRLLAGGLEQVAHTACPHTHEHLHEVGARHRHERHTGLTRHRPGEQRLAGAGRADQQHALRDAGADLLEAGRDALQYQISPGGAIRINALDGGLAAAVNALITRNSVSCGVEPRNGGRPVSSSYRIAPSP